MAHTGTEETSAAGAATLDMDIDSTAAFFTSPRSFEKATAQRPENNFDIPNQMLDEFGQDTLMGLSDLDAYLGDMGNGLSNGLSTNDDIGDLTTALQAPANTSNPIIHIEESSSMRMTDVAKTESASVTTNALGQDKAWQQNPNDYIRYATLLLSIHSSQIGPDWDRFFDIMR